MSNVLITGIAGLLGSQLARHLLAEWKDVSLWGIDNYSCGYEENVPEEVVDLWWVDLGEEYDYEALKSIFYRSGGFDYIFHFAAYAAEGLSPFIRTYNYTNNLLATAQLVNMAIKYPPKRFVFTSSMAVYGKGTPPFHEDDPCNPIDPYGIAKLACEQDIQAAGIQHGLEWTIIRPHNIYGPGQSIWQRYRNVFGVWMERLLNNQPILIYGDGEQKRAFSYIGDCVGPIARAVTSAVSRQKIYNVGGSRPVTLNEAAELLLKVTGRGEIEYREARHEVKYAYSTYERSFQLGYEDKTPLEDGLRLMWEWAQDAYTRYPERQETHNIAKLEVEEGLYSYWQEYVRTEELPPLSLP